MRAGRPQTQKPGYGHEAGTSPDNKRSLKKEVVTVPEFNIARAREFLASALEAPLFRHVGEPFADENVVRVETLAQYQKAMRSGTWATVGKNRGKAAAGRLRRRA